MYDYTRSIVAEVMKHLYARGLVSAFAGNVSARVDGGFLITPSGLHRALLGPEDIVLVDYEGRRLWGRRKPSSEWRMHAAIYRARSDVAAIVHAHPPMLVALYMAGGELRGPLELDVFFGGRIPVVGVHPPGSVELARSVAEAIGRSRAVVLKSHGAVTVDRDLWEAEGLMEVLEEAASMVLGRSG